MTNQSETTQKNHHRAVRFFWCFLICASVVSLVGNVAHAVLPFIPHVLIQIGAAAVPPIALLAAVHGIALAVRAGASGLIYRWAVAAVGSIGVGAFAVSFLALRDLMQAIGYSTATAWVFPAIIDTTVAVSTTMLVALGEKPARRPRTVTASATAHTSRHASRRHGTPNPTVQGANSEAGRATAVQNAPVAGKQVASSIQPDPVQTVQASAHSETAQVDADLASELLASGVTTQPTDIVIAVLAAHRRGASINAAAKASGINYRTAQRIVRAAGTGQQLMVAS